MDPEKLWGAADGARLGHAEALGRLARSRVVLLGERHDRAADHRWQAMVIAGLAALRAGVVVGFEMFPRRVQPALDAWTAGAMTEATFLTESDWVGSWGFDAGLYLPLFRLCRDLRLPMRALNVDRPIVRLVGRDGWPALPAAEAAWLSPARPASPAYRSYLFDATGGARPGRAASGPSDPAFDRFVRAQQVWDRAFACSIAETLAAAPDRLVVGIIGRGHLEFGHGTPDQLDDLGIRDVSVALPATPGEIEQFAAGPIADLTFMQLSIDNEQD